MKIKKNQLEIILISAITLLVIINLIWLILNFQKDTKSLHKNITTTVFWVGESASEDNAFISNTQSAWDETWMESYGGYDDPYNREGYFPADFTPKENPFYFALPYKGVKNSWIKIIKENKIAYAQWEDVGPFEINDYEYVFDYKKPKNKINNNAGLDVSPAVRDYLGLKNIDKVDWEFVNFLEVPDGPWKEIITQQ